MDPRASSPFEELVFDIFLDLFLFGFVSCRTPSVLDGHAYGITHAQTNGALPYGGLPFDQTQHVMFLTFMMTPKIDKFI